MRYRTLAVALAALLTVTASASAQQAASKLEVGQWTGKVTPPDGITVDVLYDVAYAGDTLQITIRAAEHGTFPTTEAKFDTGKISFKFRPGPDILCVLKQKEPDYEGVCTADDGSAADIVMSPPKKEAKQ